jgi:hypothetical protein
MCRPLGYGERPMAWQGWMLAERCRASHTCGYGLTVCEVATRVHAITRPIYHDRLPRKSLTHLDKVNKPLELANLWWYKWLCVVGQRVALAVQHKPPSSRKPDVRWLLHKRH